MSGRLMRPWLTVVLFMGSTLVMSSCSSGFGASRISPPMHSRYNQAAE